MGNSSTKPVEEDYDDPPSSPDTLAEMPKKSTKASGKAATSSPPDVESETYRGVLHEYSPRKKILEPILDNAVEMSIVGPNINMYDPKSGRTQEFPIGSRLNHHVKSRLKEFHFEVRQDKKTHYLIFTFDVMDDVSRFVHTLGRALYLNKFGEEPEAESQKDKERLDFMSKVDAESDSEESDPEAPVKRESIYGSDDYVDAGKEIDDLGSALSYSTIDDRGRYPDEASSVTSSTPSAASTPRRSRPAPAGTPSSRRSTRSASKDISSPSPSGSEPGTPTRTRAKAAAKTPQSQWVPRTPAKVVESSDSEDESDDYHSQEEEEDIPAPSKIREGKTFVKAKTSGRDAGVTNQLMELSLRDNRAIVMHGHEFDVFAPQGDEASLVASGMKLKDDKGKNLTPRTSLLHNSSRTMIFMDPTNADRVYGVDVETGKVIHDFSASNNLQPRDFTSATKYAQLTARPDFCGFGPSSVFRVDTRTPGIVDSTLKSYVKYENFTAMCTTESGYVAVGNAVGEIKLYRELAGKRATSLIHSSGDRITGLDVSASGQYLLATTYSYLMLFDLSMDNDATSTRFTKRAGVSPSHKRLELLGEHRTVWNIPYGFTPAHFNTGDSGETTIVTSAGPFMFTWTLSDALKPQGWRKYKMKRLPNYVVNARFLHNQEANVMVATQTDVSLVDKKSCRDPSRIVPPPKQTAAEAAGVPTYGKWF